MEARHKERMRDEVSWRSISFPVDSSDPPYSQADHAQTKLNAKLDNLTRMYENRAINTAKALNYDDSDEVESEGEEEEEEEDPSEESANEIERLLLEEDTLMQVVEESSMTAGVSLHSFEAVRR